MIMSRRKVYAIRTAIHNLESSLKTDRSPEAERKRDLLSVACCDLWEGKFKKMICRLRRVGANDILSLIGGA